MATFTAEIEASTATAPKPPSRRWRRLILRTLLLTVGIVVGWFWLGQPAARRHQLMAACASADRVVLAYRMPPTRAPDGRWSGGERVTCEILGAGKVHEFLALIEPCPSTPMSMCKCLPDPAIEVTRGNTALASLTLHHDKAMRWRDGKWTGDAQLTPASILAIRAWIEKEGGSELHALLDRLDAQQELYLATIEAECDAAMNAATKPGDSSTRMYD